MRNLTLNLFMLESKKRNFSGAPVVKTPSSHCKGGRVPSLVGELSSHMLQRLGQKIKSKKKVNKTAGSVKKAAKVTLGTVKGRGWRK